MRFQLRRGNPQLLTLVTYLTPTALEQMLGEQPCVVRSDKLGTTFVIDRGQLKPVKARSGRREASQPPSAKLDARLERAGLDPHKFASRKMKQEVLKRLRSKA